MNDGSGLKNLIPALSAERLQLENPRYIVCLVRKGIPLNPLTNQEMPGNSEMTDVEMANLINFLGHKYNGIGQTVNVTEIPDMESNCQTR